MRLVCLGSDAQDTIDAANRRYALTSSTSGKMLDFFNAEGGNTSLKKTTAFVAKDEPGFFDKAWGIFEKLGTIASPAKTVVHTVKPAGPPIMAMAGIGIVGFLLFKAVK